MRECMSLNRALQPARTAIPYRGVTAIPDPGRLPIDVLIVLAIHRHAPNSRHMNDQYSAMAVGIGVGAAIGAAMDNVSMGIAVGVALGAAVGAAYHARKGE